MIHLPPRHLSDRLRQQGWNIALGVIGFMIFFPLYLHLGAPIVAKLFE